MSTSNDTSGAINVTAKVKSIDGLTAMDFGQSCVCHALRSSARLVARRYEEALRPVGLKAGQFSIMAALLGRGAVRLTRLANDLGMDRTTLTKDLRPLEKKGLVVSVADEQDARVRGLQLTEQGVDLLRQAVPLWQKVQAEFHQRVNEQAWQDTRKLLDSLTR